MKVLRSGAALVGLAAMACAGSGGQPSGESTNKPRKHVTVQFTDMTIHPSTARVLPGGDIAWLNYSMSYVGTVVFPASIKSSFTCDDLRPQFAKVADGYESDLIRGDMANVITPCPLEPGSYEYEIRLFEGGGGMGGAPMRSLQGRIVVEPAQPTAKESP